MRISDWSSDVCSSDLVMTASFMSPGPFRVVIERMPLASLPVYLDVNCVAQRIVRRLANDFGNGGVRMNSGRHFLDPCIQEPGTSGRASCRETVCQYVYISGVGASLKKKNHIHI